MVARAHAVGQCEKHESIEIFPVADNTTELLDRGGVLKIPTLSHLRENVVRIHEGQEHTTAVGGELEATCDLVGQHGSSFLMVPRIGRLAHIMKQDR